MYMYILCIWVHNVYVYACIYPVGRGPAGSDGDKNMYNMYIPITFFFI